MKLQNNQTQIRCLIRYFLWNEILSLSKNVTEINDCHLVTKIASFRLSLHVYNIPETKCS
jgi:hypothetical protein